jgi:crotonobetainyl-CoA:carnitine CoA-transferase CaiB-like acyl-CoA transferase
MDDLGLGYESLREYNHDIIYCSINGFRENSVYGHLPAMDLMIQAMSGAMSVTGEETQPPINTGVPIADLSAVLNSGL